MKLLNKKLKGKRKQIQIALGLLLSFGFVNLILDLFLYFMRDNYIFISSSFLGMVFDFVFIVIGTGFALAHIKELYDFYIYIRSKNLNTKDKKDRVLVAKKIINFLKVYFVLEPLIFFYAVKINFTKLNPDLLIEFNILFLVFTAIVGILFLCAASFYIASRIAIKMSIKKIEQQQIVGELGLCELGNSYLTIDDLILNTSFINIVYENISKIFIHSYLKKTDSKFKLNIKERILNDTIYNNPPATI